MPRRQNSRWKSRLQRVCRVQWRGILFMGWMTFHIQHISPQLGMIDAPVLVGKKSPVTARQVSPSLWILTFIRKFLWGLLRSKSLSQDTRLVAWYTWWSKFAGLQRTFLSELTAFNQRCTLRGCSSESWCYVMFIYDDYIHFDSESFLSVTSYFTRQTGKKSVYIGGCCSLLQWCICLNHVRRRR